MSLTETIYTRIDGFINDLPIYFLNHGYSPAYSEFEGVQFKHQLSLYKKTIDGLSLDNKSILEVGCGRGGGSKWISDTYNVNMYGCDITPVHIAVCKKNEKENLQYTVANADELPYKAESMDVIFSIEASQAFQDLKAFFEKAFNILKSDGKIIIVDMYPISNVDRNKMMRDLDTYKDIASLWFKDVEIEIITDNVKQALLEDTQLMKNYIKDDKVSFFAVENAKDSYSRYANSDIGYFKLTGNKI
jgi:cyclopropane fatty-acyl-phospholipid synthase-like methyltransferase